MTAIDPTDNNHVLFAQADARDAAVLGRGCARRANSPTRVSVRLLRFQNTAGAGNDIYALLGDSIWSSGDLGATWTQTQRPSGQQLAGLLVSRDDPRSAYVRSGTQELRTRDGGKTWNAIPSDTAIQINAIVPGSPDHVLTPTSESTDGGATWAPAAAACYPAPSTTPRVRPAGASPARTTRRTERRSRRPRRSLPPRLGVFASPDVPGALAIARGSCSATCRRTERGPRCSHLPRCSGLRCRTRSRKRPGRPRAARRSMPRISTRA